MGHHDETGKRAMSLNSHFQQFMIVKGELRYLLQGLPT
jgi:hypothetical protein